MEEVLELQGDGEASPWSWASPGWISFPVPLAALTLCLHILVPALRPSGTIFSFATNTTDNFLTLDVKKRGLSFSIGGVWNSSNAVIYPGLWTSLCLAYHPARGWTSYIDGHDDDSGFLHGPDGRPPPRAPGRAGWVVVGQDQDRLGGGYQADQSFRGSVARLRIWSRRLPPQDIVAVAQCDASQDYDAVFVWPSPRAWALNHTAQMLQVPRLDICRPKGPFLMLLSAKMSLGMAQRLCTAAASHVVIPVSQGETETILSLALEAGSSCSGRPNEPLVWLGASDEDTEGRWVDEEGSLLSYENWMEGQPNGMTLENRAVMTNAGTWMDLHTRNYLYCAVCSTKSGRPLLLRMMGLCSGLQHDTRYIQEGHVLAKPFFRGFTISNISWNGTKWLAQHKASPEVVLSFTPEDPRELPLGRKTWVVAGRSDCGDESGRLVLAFTTCAPGHFTCDDGSCISANMRCDFQPDCKDESDETECETVTLPPAYKSNIPPRPASSTPDTPAHPISLHITVLSLEIVTGKMEIVMDFIAMLRWTDPRLVFRDLKHDQATNALQLSALRSLWVPQVSFSNAKGNAHTLLDEETKGLVLRHGEARPGDHTQAREVDFFGGEENPVVASRKYSATYRCSLDLTLYPFDTQECNFVFLLTSARKERLQMVRDGKGVTYSGSRQLLEYSIVSIVTRPANHTRYSALQAIVRFRRRYGFAILTVYTPSCFFVIIAYLTTFYPLSNLQVRVVIALTAMLVLTTLLSQVSSNLPRNSYFKALDVWMFGAIGLIFSILILQTVVDVVARGEEASKVSPKQDKGMVHVESSIMGPRKTAEDLFPRTLLAPRMMRAMQVGYPAVTFGLVVAYVAYLFAALN